MRWGPAPAAVPAGCTPGFGGVLGVQALPGRLHSGPLALEVGVHWLLPGSQLGCSEWQVVPDPK